MDGLDLFKSIDYNGINDRLFDKLNPFYKEFWHNDSEREAYIRSILAYEGSNIPRRMLNNVERLIKLSDDIVKIRKGDTLRVFFIVVCIETLYSLLEEHNKIKMKKQEMVIDFFENAITDSDRTILGEKFKVVIDGHNDDGTNRIETFAIIINEVRNIFAHEGESWAITFSDGESSMINVINTSVIKGKEKYDIGYELGMTFLEFRVICIKGFINLVKNFFDSIYKS